MKSVGVMTLGCKVNTYESEYVINELKKAGYEIKDFDDICDVYIINTCTVTNNSDSKSRKMIRQAIRRNPNACVVAMGCFIAANPDIEIDGLDIILGLTNTYIPETGRSSVAFKMNLGDYKVKHEIKSYKTKNEVFSCNFFTVYINNNNSSFRTRS